MIYKVSKTKLDVIRFLNFVENSLDIEVTKKGNLKLVLEELLTNSINHTSNNIKPLEIEIDVHNDSINIEYHEYSDLFNIYDYYNEKDIMEDNINKMEEGGLGIFLIFNLIKNYQFIYDKKHLKNIMKFNI
ncbi:ATP-binding protein [Silvanigrella sp.]|jgi:anti-sigma regulatory factor (Ser/Thr protein kinase)|uniref:ATP-binding protein n=1 Tax=Silvanigrella sp. TaxID=2024976 RepID=UPI0037CB24A9